MSEISSRHIPLPMQREIRKRCGFGCVICGLPLYEYDHLLGWANVKRHVGEEITLLCNQHHREKTAELLPIEKVREANKTPFNLREGVSKPYVLHYSGAECEVEIGKNLFSTRDGGHGTTLVPISIDGTALLRFVLEDGHLLLNLNLFDEYNRLVLQILDNQLCYVPSQWDIQLTARNLIVREAARRILIEMVFEVPNRVVVRRGRFLRNGVEVLVGPEHVVIVNKSGRLTGNIMKNVRAGIVIGPHKPPLPGVIKMENVSRYLGDRAAVKRWVKECFEAGC